jgi:hypothetical protein
MRRYQIKRGFISPAAMLSRLGLSWIVKKRYFSRFADPRTPDGLSPKRRRNV